MRRFSNVWVAMQNKKCINAKTPNAQDYCRPCLSVKISSLYYWAKNTFVSCAFFCLWTCIQITKFKHLLPSLFRQNWLLNNREGKSRDPLLGGFWRHFCLYIAYRHKTIGQILVIIVISYYRFPSDRNMLKNCLKAIRRDNCSFVYYSAILTMFIALPVP